VEEEFPAAPPGAELLEEDADQPEAATSSAAADLAAYVSVGLSAAASKYAPLKVVLHPAGPRNCVNFVSDLGREPDLAKRNSSLVMFEHFPGARVHEVGLHKSNPVYP
jgi:hypothetical protein